MPTNDGPRADWQARVVSAYASAYPGKDWPESWAYYCTSPISWSASVLAAGSIEAMTASWLPLTYAINSINRSMGQPAFVLSPRAVEKRGFVTEMMSRARQRIRWDNP